jgi:hypothetical protein
MPAIDFTQVQSLDPLPDGIYNVEIVSAQEGSSKTGNPKIDIRWKVTDGAYEGRQIFDSMSFHRDALWRTKKTLQALGFDDDFNGEVTSDMLISRQATVTVITEHSNQVDPTTGEPYPDRNKVTRVNPPNDLLGFVS